MCSRSGAVAGVPAPAIAWSRTFPATRDQVGAARRFLAAIVNDATLAGDAVLCLSELASNSVEHSRSASPAGTFTVRVTLRAGRVRVEVEDQGGPWAPRHDVAEECGRGLLLVRELAGGYTVTGGEAGRTIAFELDLRGASLLRQASCAAGGARMSPPAR